MDLTNLSNCTRLFTQQNPHLQCLYQNYKKSLLKAHLRKNQLKFLKKCRQEKVIPKSFLPQHLRNLDNLAYSELDDTLLKHYIKSTSEQVKSAFQKKEQAKVILKNSVSREWWDTLNSYIYGLLTRQNEFQRNKLEDKFNSLFENSMWTKKSDPRLFVNLSSYELDKTETLALGFGMRFSVEKPVDPVDIAKSFIHLEKNKQEDVPQENILIAKGCVYGLLHGKNSSNIPKSFQIALRKLKSNKDIHITKADKANTIVILDEVCYNNKMSDLLNDEVTYIELTKDPTENVNSDFNKKMKTLLKDKPELVKQFTQINPTLPYMYGIVKTHKPDNPLRPIVSSVGSAGYKLSKWLGKQLAPLVGNISNSNITNAVDLINKLRRHNTKCQLVSFDVNSLFTKVPVHDLLEYLKEKLHLLDLPVSQDVFLKLLELCVVDNVFIGNGKYYKQQFGMSMGNALSPILSNIYMEFYETKLLPGIHNFDIVWYRYVDDVLCLWPEEEDINEFLISLNNLVPSIKFKTEIEVRSTLPFLDVLIVKSHNGFKFKVFRKPTHTEGYIHYFSNHSNSIKMSVFSGMFLRGLRICDPEYLEEEIQHIKTVASKLCYPPYFIEKCFIKARRTFFSTVNSVKSNYKNMLVLPYHKELLPLGRMLEPLKINVVFKYDSTIRNKLIKNSPNNDKVGCVYKIPCQICDKVYVGQTGKPLKKRISQHKYSIRTGCESSALFIHLRDNDHYIDWQHSSTIYNSNCQTERLLVESCVIGQCNSMNLNDGMYKMDNILSNQLSTSYRIKMAIDKCKE